MIDLSRLAFFVPGHLQKFKLNLFNRIASHIEALGGVVVRGDFAGLHSVVMDDRRVPIIGCTPELKPYLKVWIAEGLDWIYWDRGYARRVFATWLPRGDNGGYYRWHLNSFQMKAIREVSGDRWKSLNTPLENWKLNSSGHILLAEPSPTYQRFHEIQGWTEKTIEELRKHTDRKIVRRTKESKVPLSVDLAGAHAMVTHGSNAAVEAVIMGCPVFVAPDSAASLIGEVDVSRIETPLYPSREAWARSLAYCQFNEQELVDGTLWRFMD